MTPLYFLQLKGQPILQQLQLEEALLRTDERNWCLINEGSPPALVMGISGKPELLVNPASMEKHPIPLIRRFSGGGTVVVDEDTLFVSFIFQKEAHPFEGYPEPILQWSADIYRSLFPSGLFQVRENDYVLKEKKCGGNAQYIQKKRWLHHTTFLWDFKKERMDYLLHPPRTPQYRANRTHEDFVCRLVDYLPSKNDFINHIKCMLKERYALIPVSAESLSLHQQQPHRQTTEVVTNYEFNNTCGPTTKSVP